MWGARFFGRAFFGLRYWGVGGAAPPTVPTKPDGRTLSLRVSGQVFMRVTVTP